MSERTERPDEPTGMFMEALRRGRPAPPAARTLGFEVVDVDPHAGRIEVRFAATEAFTTPYGEVLGGFLAAMLYDTVGPAVLATLRAGEFIVTHDLRTEFLRPAHVGTLIGRGQIIRQDGRRRTVEATLSEPDGTVVATAEAHVEIVDRVVPAPAPG